VSIRAAGRPRQLDGHPDICRRREKRASAKPVGADTSAGVRRGALFAFCIAVRAMDAPAVTSGTARA
jgi:hypothetical protein